MLDMFLLASFMHCTPMQPTRQDTADSNCVVSWRLIRAPWATTCGVGGPGNSVATLVGCAEPWMPIKKRT